MSDILPEKDRCINYIEFLVSDIERAKAFYGKAFGWGFTDYGPEYCEFSDGQMKGGFAKVALADISTKGPLIVLYGDDLEKLMGEVVAAGGEISIPIFDFPGGKRFQFKDPEGYELAIWSHL